MREMYELMERMTEWFADVRKLSPETLMSLMSLGGKVQKLLEMKDKLWTR
jgi:DNA-binding transcriptional regulator GbsR (MarR family)